MALTELQRRSVERAVRAFLRAQAWPQGLRYTIDGDSVTLYQAGVPEEKTAQPIPGMPVLQLRFDPRDNSWCAYGPDVARGWSPQPEHFRARSFARVLECAGRDPEAILW